MGVLNHDPAGMAHGRFRQRLTHQEGLGSGFREVPQVPALSQESELGLQSLFQRSDPFDLDRGISLDPAAHHLRQPAPRRGLGWFWVFRQDPSLRLHLERGPEAHPGTGAGS